MKISIQLTKRQLQIGGIVVLSIVALILSRPFSVQNAKLDWSEWTGFGKDTTLSKSTTIKINNNTSVTTTESLHSGKTLWDWLDLLVIPVSLTALGFWFQWLQQKRTDVQASIEKVIAENNLREEAVQAYYDRLSDLMIDEKLITLSINDPIRIASLDIIRAKSLSILRRLSKDGERKGDILQFLFDAELITGLGLDLVGADLRGANLIGVVLSGAKLEGVDLGDADLRSTNLQGANLLGVNLKGANLCTDLDLGKDTLVAVPIRTNLRNTDLHGAVLCGAKLMGVDLCGSNLLSANLQDADIHSANLRGLAVPLSVDQVKAAKNWEYAMYDSDFRKKLGLS